MQIWINGQKGKFCPYAFPMRDFEVGLFDVSSDREFFGDLLFTKHLMEPEEISHFYTRHIAMWPEVPTSLRPYVILYISTNHYSIENVSLFF
eukprot:UN22625